MTRVDGMRAVIMPSALPIPVAALGGESHVLPFICIYFVYLRTSDDGARVVLLLVVPQPLADLVWASTAKQLLL